MPRRVVKGACALFHGAAEGGARISGRMVWYFLQGNRKIPTSRGDRPKESAVNRPGWLASLMLSLSLGRRCSMKSKTIRLFRLGAALLVLTGMRSLQACFFYDGGGHWHHWHHEHHGHPNDP